MTHGASDAHRGPPSQPERIELAPASSPAAWTGASIGLVTAILILCTLTGVFFRTGLGALVGGLFGLLVGVLALALFTAGTAVARGLLRIPPLPFILLLGGCVGTLIFLRNVRGGGWPGSVYYRLLLGMLLLQAVLGAAIASLIRGRHRAFAATLAAMVLLVDLGGAYWLGREGVLPHVPDNPATRPSVPVEPLALPNPADHGPHAVRNLTYGSGVNARRPEFGKNADVRTAPVDASKLLPEWKGFTARAREWYWGFGIKQYPINGRVWMPDGDGPFPLVLMVHGNHSMEEWSDPGYGYLGTLLASRGYIAVSIDENLTNASWSGDFRGKEEPLRGWLLLQHLERWRDWNADPSSPFYRKVDLQNIGLMGHSRGGEAVAVAAVFNRLPVDPDDATIPLGFGFGIKSVIAIAPTDHRYFRRLTLDNVNYLTLHGSYDTDLSQFWGQRQYERVRFTEPGPWFKAAVYIAHANHGQFNTVWGRYDSRPPGSWFLNVKPLIPGAEQRRIAEVFISAFLDATLRGERGYLPMFRDPRAAAAWLPPVALLHRYEDGSFRTVADYEEDLDLTTATLPGATISGDHLAVWREKRPEMRDHAETFNSVVYLGWRAVSSGDDDSTASYTITLPPGFGGAELSPPHVLVFALSATDEKIPPGGPAEASEPAAAATSEPEDTASVATPGPRSPPVVWIELVDARGQAVRLNLDRFASIRTPFYSPLLLKTRALSRASEGGLWDPVLETYRLPLQAFAEIEPRFDPTHLRAIRFRFGRSASQVIMLDRIGFAMDEP